MLKKILALVAGAFAAMSAFAAPEANEGSAADFAALPGVGPVMSQRIVDARKQGEFKDWADFMERVKGVKAKSAQKLSQGGLTVKGKPFAPETQGAAPAPAPAAPAAGQAPAKAAATAPKK